MTDRPESWRPYPGWEGWYEASDKGRARSVDRIIVYRNGRRCRHHGKILAGGLGGGGYPTVNLRRPGVCVTVKVAVMVLTTFAGPRPEGQQSRHGPRGKLFSWWPEDLCWGTRSENNGADQVRDGTINWGERNGMAKLTEIKVREIRARWAAGETQRAIAAYYGVAPSAVHEIVHRQRWAHVA